MRFFLIALMFCLFSCQLGSEQVVENQQLKLQLIEKEKEVELLKIENKKYLVHIVYFNLKPEANEKVFIEALETLRKIPVVKDFEVGKFKDLSDKRALSDFEVMMQMSFDSEQDYATYQKHPLHLELKNLAAKFVSAPPATYDYLLVD